MKPHIRRALGGWTCGVRGGICAFGKTPEIAYWRWCSLHHTLGSMALGLRLVKR